MRQLKEAFINKKNLKDIKTGKTFGILREGDIVELNKGQYMLVSFGHIKLLTTEIKPFENGYLVGLGVGWFDLKHYDRKTLKNIDSNNDYFNIVKVYRPSTFIDKKYEYLTQNYLERCVKKSELIKDLT